jgi:hypothetical protein
MDCHLVTLAEIGAGLSDEERAQLASGLPGKSTVGEPDEGGLVELSVEADSRDGALATVRDAIAAAGVEERVTFPRTTGTFFRPKGERALDM